MEKAFLHDFVHGKKKTTLPHNSLLSLCTCTKFATCLLHDIISDIWNFCLSMLIRSCPSVQTNIFTGHILVMNVLWDNSCGHGNSESHIILTNESMLKQSFWQEKIWESTVVVCGIPSKRAFRFVFILCKLMQNSFSMISSRTCAFAKIVYFNDISIAENVSLRFWSYPKFLCVCLCDCVFVCEDSRPKYYVQA